MLTVFKGELTLHDILWGLPKKRLMELRDVRRDRLIEEQKEMERMDMQNQSQAIRNQILAP